MLVALAVIAGMGPGAEAGHEGTALALTIRAEELQRLIATGQGPTLLDSRDEAAYQAGHLPGARSVHGVAPARRLTDVPRTAVVVVYGATTLDAIEAYQQLRHDGYSNVRVLAGGFPAWIALKYAVEQGTPSAR
jgi:rhodanese-related sulfurtransferase